MNYSSINFVKKVKKLIIVSSIENIMSPWEEKLYNNKCNFEEIARDIFLLCSIALGCRFFAAYVMFITRFCSIYLCYFIQ